MTENKKQRGGAGRGQGRKPIRPGEDTVAVYVRVTTSQRDKMKRLGGAKWMRRQIDEADDPDELSL